MTCLTRCGVVTTLEQGSGGGILKPVTESRGRIGVMLNEEFGKKEKERKSALLSGCVCVCVCVVVVEVLRRESASCSFLNGACAGDRAALKQATKHRRSVTLYVSRATEVGEERELSGGFVLEIVAAGESERANCILSLWGSE